MPGRRRGASSLPSIASATDNAEFAGSQTEHLHSRGELEMLPSAAQSTYSHGGTAEPGTSITGAASSRAVLSAPALQGEPSTSASGQLGAAGRSKTLSRLVGLFSKGDRGKRGAPEVAPDVMLSTQGSSTAVGAPGGSKWLMCLAPEVRDDDAFDHGSHRSSLESAGAHSSQQTGTGAHTGTNGTGSSQTNMGTPTIAAARASSKRTSLERALMAARGSKGSKGSTQQSSVKNAMTESGSKTRQSFDSDWDVMGTEDAAPLSGAQALTSTVNSVESTAKRQKSASDSKARGGDANSGRGRAQQGGAARDAASKDSGVWRASQPRTSASGNSFSSKSTGQRQTPGRGQQTPEWDMPKAGPAQAQTYHASTDLAQKMMDLQNQINALTDEDLLNPSGKLSFVSSPSGVGMGGFLINSEGGFGGGPSGLSTGPRGGLPSPLRGSAAAGTAGNAAGAASAGALGGHPAPSDYPGGGQSQAQLVQQQQVASAQVVAQQQLLTSVASGRVPLRNMVSIGEDSLLQMDTAAALQTGTSSFSRLRTQSNEGMMLIGSNAGELMGERSDTALGGRHPGGMSTSSQGGTASFGAAAPNGSSRLLGSSATSGLPHSSQLQHSSSAAAGTRGAAGGSHGTSGAAPGGPGGRFNISSALSVFQAELQRSIQNPISPNGLLAGGATGSGPAQPAGRGQGAGTSLGLGPSMPATGASMPMSLGVSMPMSMPMSMAMPGGTAGTTGMVPMGPGGGYGAGNSSSIMASTSAALAAAVNALQAQAGARGMRGEARPIFERTSSRESQAHSSTAATHYGSGGVPRRMLQHPALLQQPSLTPQQLAQQQQQQAYSTIMAMGGFNGMGGNFNGMGGVNAASLADMQAMSAMGAAAGGNNVNAMFMQGMHGLPMQPSLHVHHVGQSLAHHAPLPAGGAGPATGIGPTSLAAAGAGAGAGASSLHNVNAGPAGAGASGGGAGAAGGGAEDLAEGNTTEREFQGLWGSSKGFAGLMGSSKTTQEVLLAGPQAFHSLLGGGASARGRVSTADNAAHGSQRISTENLYDEFFMGHGGEPGGGKNAAFDASLMQFQQQQQQQPQAVVLQQLAHAQGLQMPSGGSPSFGPGAVPVGRHVRRNVSTEALRIQALTQAQRSVESNSRQRLLMASTTAANGSLAQQAQQQGQQLQQGGSTASISPSSAASGHAAGAGGAFGNTTGATDAGAGGAAAGNAASPHHHTSGLSPSQITHLGLMDALQSDASGLDMLVRDLAATHSSNGLAAVLDTHASRMRSDNSSVRSASTGLGVAVTPTGAAAVGSGLSVGSGVVGNGAAGGNMAQEVHDSQAAVFSRTAANAAAASASLRERRRRGSVRSSTSQRELQSHAVTMDAAVQGMVDSLLREGGGASVLQASAAVSGGAGAGGIGIGQGQNHSGHHAALLNSTASVGSALRGSSSKNGTVGRGRDGGVGGGSGAASTNASLLGHVSNSLTGTLHHSLVAASPPSAMHNGSSAALMGHAMGAAPLLAVFDEYGKPLLHSVDPSAASSSNNAASRSGTALAGTGAGAAGDALAGGVAPANVASRLQLQAMSLINGVAVPRARHSTAELFLLVAGGLVILFNLLIIMYVMLTMNVLVKNVVSKAGEL